MACNQSMYDSVLDLMEEMKIRGFTGWEELTGRGGESGEPHLGSHAWPAMNSALLTVLDDRKAAEFMERLKRLDEENEQQGLRAFAWEITGAI